MPGLDLRLLRVVVTAMGRVGVLVDDRVIDLNRAWAASSPGLPADRVPADLESLIALGTPALDDVRAAVAFALEQAPDNPRIVAALESVRIVAPAVRRPRIACAAGNYAAHTLGSAARKGASASRALAGIVDAGAGGPLPTADELTQKTRERGTPRGFWKDFALPHGPEDDVARPARADLFDYEGEVAVVIGPTVKDVAPGRGADAIWGVTLLNDWSIRGTSQKDSLSFNLSKNFDGGASIGPCIVVGGLNPSDLWVETRVNGEVRQHYHSGDMIFDHATFIEYLSRDFTFLPGDIVSGGSGPGSATDATKGDDPDYSLFLQVGDVVEVSAEPIGVLRNRIVAR
jgi:2-keto-4-pentenoate hydratase/2-oxohepta-3-ene-1,7-dioic acid hydratase in catechol pathway